MSSSWMEQERGLLFPADVPRSTCVTEALERLCLENRAMRQDGGVLIPVPLTNQELANYSAMARKSLNRMLGELKKAGVIEYRDHLLVIKDLAYLKREIQCENCGREICNIE